MENGQMTVWWVSDENIENINPLNWNYNIINGMLYEKVITNINVLDDEQKIAFTIMNKTTENLFITGKAGTGKSSSVSAFLEALKDYVYVQCALSGRASSRMAEITGEEGYTILRKKLDSGNIETFVIVPLKDFNKNGDSSR